VPLSGKNGLLEYIQGDISKGGKCPQMIPLSMCLTGLNANCWNRGRTQ